MRQHGIQDIWRGKNKRTTRRDDRQQNLGDLVKRNLTATKPNWLWVVVFTYVQTLTGWVYVAFIIDVYSRAVVGWKASRRMKMDMVLDV